MSLYDDLPKSLRIGPFDVPVVIKDKIDDDDNNWGQYQHGVAIDLKREQPNIVFATDTLIHEILHGIHRCCGLDDSSTEEAVVTGLATGLTQVLRDNPGLINWLYRAQQ